LLAPKKLEFYDMSWSYRGSKHNLVQNISDITRIPIEILQGEDSLADYSIAMKMSWAARRKTTRVEDMAYCLLGIFDVNMSLIYGEGMKAFRRLQEEIVKRKNDLTIFAWNTPPDQETQILSLFATSPEAFVDSSDIVPFDDVFSEYSVTNRGLLMSGDIPMEMVDLSGTNSGCEILRYFIALGINRRVDNFMRGIYLRKVGPKLFYRDGVFPLAGFGLSEVAQKHVSLATSFYILIEPDPTVQALASDYRDGALYIPHNDLFRLATTVPENLWDYTDRIFLRPVPYFWADYSMVLAMRFRSMLPATATNIVILCDCRPPGPPTCKVFEASSQACIVFLERYRNDSIHWEELELQAPDILSLNNCTDISGGDRIYTVSVSFEKGSVESISEHGKFHNLFSMKVTIA
jgi:hypothetical protein